MIPRVAPEHQLRLCVVGDLEGVHTQSWLQYFVERGHEVHGVSYYAPLARPPEGVTVHALRPAPARGGRPLTGARPGLDATLGRRLPPGIQRLVNLLRYRRAGLRRAVEEASPEVLHAHYLTEHAFYATSAGFRPYVVSAWGSDVLVDAAGSPLSRAIARSAVSHADQATANNRHLAREMVLRLGIERGRVQHIVLGVQRAFLDRPEASVNAQPRSAMPTVISTRSLDKPLYHIDVILRAMARALERLPAARLVVAGEGRLRPALESLTARLGLSEAVRFAGFLSQEELRRELEAARVFVSIPSSDATSVALLQAMAVGCLPIVSDLPSQHELVEHGVGGLRVPVGDAEALAEAIVRALEDGELRRSAFERNRRFVEEYGVLETNMARMEAWYYRLVGRMDDWQAERFEP